jgi:hypothetical protein
MGVDSTKQAQEHSHFATDTVVQLEEEIGRLQTLQTSQVRPAALFHLHSTLHGTLPHVGVPRLSACCASHVCLEIGRYMSEPLAILVLCAYVD